MNSKPLLFIAALCGGACLVFAQGGSGGAGGAGAGAGASAGASASSGNAVAGAGGTSANAAATAPGSTSNAASAGISADARANAGAPDTRPTMPSRSVLDTGTPPDTTPPVNRGELPAGLSVAPARPGISPLSGLPINDIPAVSRGTAPLGPRINITASESQPEARAAERAEAPAVTDPAAVAAHPLTNPQIGMGATTVVPTPPPPNPPEATPAAPANTEGQAWVGGHYSWTGGQWTWVNGSWQRPPNPNATWIPGVYDAQNKRWTEGHWDNPATPSR